MNKNIKAHLAVLCTNLFFAANFSFVKLISPSLIKPFGLNVFRVGISLILFWLVWMMGKTQGGIARKDWKRFFLCALTGVAINQMLFIKGLTMTSTVHASLLMLTTPLLITVFALWVLKESIIRMLARLEPKRIIVVSSSPQIRYPDCYGIDMSKLGDFIAFNAAIHLLKERRQEGLLKDLYEQCKEMFRNNQLHSVNLVKQVYKPFTNEEITKKIAQLITPPGLQIPVDVLFQTIESLHEACPNNKGDWYFTGNYPTPGGNRVVNKAFMNYMEGKNTRGY